jgi:hypothetical protein
MQLPDHHIDLPLERNGLAKSPDVDNADRLAGIARRHVILVEVDDVGTVGGAVQRTGEEAEHQRQRRTLVTADRQQEPVVGTSSVGQWPARAVDHPASGIGLPCCAATLTLP